MKTDFFGNDIWLKAAQIVSDLPIVLTDYYFKPFIEIQGSQIVSLYRNNVFESDNDRQANEVFKYFKITKKSFEQRVDLSQLHLTNAKLVSVSRFHWVKEMTYVIRAVSILKKKGYIIECAIISLLLISAYD